MNYTKLALVAILCNVFAYADTHAMTPSSTQFPDAIIELADYYNNNRHMDSNRECYATTLQQKLSESTFSNTTGIKKIVRSIILDELTVLREEINRTLRQNIAHAVDAFIDATNNTCSEPGNRLSSPMGQLLRGLRSSTDEKFASLASALSARTGFFKVCGHFMALQIEKFSEPSLETLFASE